MNRKNLQKTLDLLVAKPESYDQTFWVHSCGTPACVAGFAVAACGGEITDDFDHIGDRLCRIPEIDEAITIHAGAARLLDLQPDEASVMFFGSGHPHHRAVAMLKHAIAKGEIRW